MSDRYKIISRRNYSRGIAHNYRDKTHIDPPARFPPRASYPLVKKVRRSHEELMKEIDITKGVAVI